MVSERLSPVIHVFRYATDDIHKQQNSAVFLFDFLALFPPPPLCSFRLYFLQVFCMYFCPLLCLLPFSLSDTSLKKKKIIWYLLYLQTAGIFLLCMEVILDFLGFLAHT